MQAVKDQLISIYLPDDPTPKTYNRKYLFDVRHSIPTAYEFVDCEYHKARVLYEEYQRGYQTED